MPPAIHSDSASKSCGHPIESTAEQLQTACRHSTFRVLRWRLSCGAPLVALVVGLLAGLKNASVPALARCPDGPLRIRARAAARGLRRGSRSAMVHGEFEHLNSRRAR